MEAYRYNTPRGLYLDYSLPKETIIDLPEPARERLSAILAPYNRDIPDWNEELAYHVNYRRNLPFAILYFDKEYPLGGYITANRWDKYESPYQYYSSHPDPEMKFAGCWWFRTKERLEYASHRSSIAAQAWELLSDTNSFSPWVVFIDRLNESFVSEAAKLNEHLPGLRRRDADLETTFPFNGEELTAVFQNDSRMLLGGTTIWLTTPFISYRLDEILKPYNKKVFDLIIKISSVYNSKLIKPWLTIWLDREYDLADYFHHDCGLTTNEIKTITYTDDFNITPEEFYGHIPFSIIYFATKEDARICAKKSSLVALWWEHVKDLREDRGWMYVPTNNLRAYESTDLFVPIVETTTAE